MSVFRDPAVLNIIKDAKVHLEFCPTSNLCTGAITHLEQHPIEQAFEEGLGFSINTDNPGAFDCTLTSEHQLPTKVFGFKEADFSTIFRNSLEARFQPRLRYIQPAAADKI